MPRIPKGNQVAPLEAVPSRLQLLLQGCPSTVTAMSMLNPNTIFCHAQIIHSVLKEKKERKSDVYIFKRSESFSD